MGKDDAIWDTALKELKYKITKKNIHQRFYGDRLFLQTNLKNAKYPKSCENSTPDSHKVNLSSFQENKINTLIGLNKLMAEVSMKPIIKGQCAKPFHMIYSLPDQLDLYKDFVKKCSNPVFLYTYEGFIEKTYIYNRE